MAGNSKWMGSKHLRVLYAPIGINRRSNGPLRSPICLNAEQTGRSLWLPHNQTRPRGCGQEQLGIRYPANLSFLFCHRSQHSSLPRENRTDHVRLGYFHVDQAADPCYNLTGGPLRDTTTLPGFLQPRLLRNPSG